MKKLLMKSIDQVANFLNSRNPREKVMFIVLAAAGVLTVVYFIAIQPVYSTLVASLPELTSVSQDLKALQDDYKNREQIEKSWAKTKNLLAAKESMFIAPNEIPALLENLSKLAQSSGVKILTLKPEAASSESGPYQRIPIKISCLAGTHEFGKFLSQLENNTIFFLVTDVKIQNSPTDLRRHSMELSLEVYRRGV